MKIQGTRLSVENLTPFMNTIRVAEPAQEYQGTGSNYLIVDFGKKEVGDECVAQLRVVTELDVYKAGASCGCTRPSYVKDETGYVVTVKFDSNLISEGVSKFVTIDFTDGTKMKINIKIN